VPTKCIQGGSTTKESIVSSSIFSGPLHCTRLDALGTCSECNTSHRQNYKKYLYLKKENLESGIALEYSRLPVRQENRRFSFLHKPLFLKRVDT